MASVFRHGRFFDVGARLNYLNRVVLGFTLIAAFGGATCFVFERTLTEKLKYETGYAECLSRADYVEQTILTGKQKRELAILEGDSNASK